MSPRIPWNQRRGLRLFAAAALTAVLLAGAGPIAARAAGSHRFMVRVSGKLSVSAATPISVIATDPVLQQVLAQDFQVAGRLANANATSAVTITVTLVHRVLEPGMALNDIARGDPAALALLKKAGVKSPPAPDAQSGEASQAARSADQTAAEGNTAAGNDIKSYQEEGPYQEMAPPPASTSGPSMNPIPIAPAPVPLASAQDRTPFYQYAHSGTPLLPDTSMNQSAVGKIYDTIFVARATTGSGPDALTVIAVVHPGYRPHEIRQLIAENIANAVLH